MCILFLIDFSSQKLYYFNKLNHVINQDFSKLLSRHYNIWHPNGLVIAMLLQGAAGAGWHPNGLVLVMLLQGATGAGWHPNGLVLVMLLQGATGAG